MNLTAHGGIVCLAIAFALCLAWLDETAWRLPRGTMVRLACAAIPLGYLFARVFFVAFSWDQYESNPLSVFWVWEGGFALFGAGIGIVLGALIFARIARLSPWRLLDALAAPLMLGVGIGRWADFASQASYGPAILSANRQFFPLGQFIDALGEWRLALFFFSSLGCMLLCYFLRRRYAQGYREGDMWMRMMLLYGAGRVVLESMRVDSLYLGFVRVSQVCAIAMMVVVLAAKCVQRLRLHRVQMLDLVLIVLSFAGVVVAFLSEFYMAMENQWRNRIFLLLAMVAFAGAGMVQMERVRKASEGRVADGRKSSKRAST